MVARVWEIALHGLALLLDPDKLDWSEAGFCIGWRLIEGLVILGREDYI